MSAFRFNISEKADLGAAIADGSTPGDRPVTMLAYSGHRDITTSWIGRLGGKDQRSAVEDGGHFGSVSQIQFAFEAMCSLMQSQGFNLGEKEGQAGKVAVVPVGMADGKPLMLQVVQAPDFRERVQSDVEADRNAEFIAQLAPVYARLLGTAYREATITGRAVYLRFGLLSTGVFRGKKIDEATAVTLSATALSRAIALMPADFYTQVTPELIHRGKSLDTALERAIGAAEPAGNLTLDVNVARYAPDAFARAMARLYHERASHFPYNFTMSHRDFAEALMKAPGEAGSLYGNAADLRQRCTQEENVSDGGHCAMLMRVAHCVAALIDGAQAGAGAPAGEPALANEGDPAEPEVADTTAAEADPVSPINV